MARFDAYTATCRTVDSSAAIRMAMRVSCPTDRTDSGRGYHRFEHKFSIRGADGSEAVSVLWGGQQGDLVMIEGKGDRTPDLVQAIREAIPEHRCTRVDSCEDFNEPGVWDRFMQDAVTVKSEHGLRGEKRGDWDFPEDGRTLYLGAPTSAVRARIYEKGKQPDFRHLGLVNLVRAEVQVRPVKEARNSYSTLAPLEVWGASAFTRDLASRLLSAKVARVASGCVWRQPSRERAMDFMCRQYGVHLQALKEELGDWQCVGLTLGDRVTEQQKRRRAGSK